MKFPEIFSNLTKQQHFFIFDSLFILLGACMCFLYYPIGNEAVDSWYGEIKDYNWSNPGFAGNTGN